MSCRSLTLPLLLAILIAAPASAQAPQFRADITQTGDAPFNGTLYFGANRMRMEGVSDGEEVTAIIDTAAGTLIVLMDADRMYMTMDVGSSPVSAAGATSMDPENPCSGGDISDCRSLGSETVNGYAARGWEYTRNGERETAWIANELRFPVRTIEEDGTTTDMTNVVMGPQPSSLFEPPSDYTAMDLGGFGGLGGGRGRGGRGAVPPGVGRGRGTPTGAVPPDGRGANPGGRGAPPGGAAAAVDPAMAAQLAAMGLDPSVIAQMQAMGLSPEQMQMMLNVGTVTNSAPWEAGDGWIVDMVVTASGSQSSAENGQTASLTYSTRFEASVPLTYGTPAVGAQMGPRWQLVGTLGSPRALAQPYTFSGTSEFRGEYTTPDMCTTAPATRTIVVANATAELTITDHSLLIGGGGVFQISGDLTTYDLSAGAGGGEMGTETVTTTTTSSGACAEPPTTETITRVPRLGSGFQLTGLLLPASPGPMSGTNTVPMRFTIFGFEGELDATVRWTLRPMN